MQVRVIDNHAEKMADVLRQGISQSEHTRIAVAFVSCSGLELLRPGIDDTVARGNTVEFLVGLDLLTSEPAALRSLYDLSCKNAQVSLLCYSDLTPGCVYHPKLYILTQPTEMQCILGSSNLTRGGLEGNVEANALIAVERDSEIAHHMLDTYNRLKFDRRRVLPDAEFLELYRELWERSRKLQQGASSDKVQRELAKRWRQKAKQLPRPRPVRRDLYGWLELVYDLTPEGEFTTKEAYGIEEACQARYPDNRNVRAKIRQQLQILAKMGLVEHVDKGRWRKL